MLTMVASLLGVMVMAYDYGRSTEREICELRTSNAVLDAQTRVHQALAAQDRRLQQDLTAARSRARTLQEVIDAVDERDVEYAADCQLDATDLGLLNRALAASGDSGLGASQ